MPDYVILNEAQRSEESKAQHRRFLAPLGMTIEPPPSFPPPPSSPRHSRAHHRIPAHIIVIPAHIIVIPAKAGIQRG